MIKADKVFFYTPASTAWSPTGTLANFVGRAFTVLCEWQEGALERRRLMILDGRMLEEIGFSRTMPRGRHARNSGARKLFGGRHLPIHGVKSALNAAFRS